MSQIELGTLVRVTGGDHNVLAEGVVAYSNESYSSVEPENGVKLVINNQRVTVIERPLRVGDRVFNTETGTPYVVSYVSGDGTKISAVGYVEHQVPRWAYRLVDVGSKEDRLLKRIAKMISDGTPKPKVIDLLKANGYIEPKVTYAIRHSTQNWVLVKSIDGVVVANRMVDLSQGVLAEIHEKYTK